MNTATLNDSNSVVLDSSASSPSMTSSANRRRNVLEELRLRTWARRNYVPAADRDPQWDPIVLDEMKQRDAELSGM